MWAHLNLPNDEILRFFDVTSFFPSIPVGEALMQFESWMSQQSISRLENGALIEIMKTCMSQNVFQFRNAFYKQDSGTAMGDPASPMPAELFMSNLESKLSKKDWIPRIWKRYVGDILAVIKAVELQNLLNALNSQSESIKFTHEVETDGKFDSTLHSLQIWKLRENMRRAGMNFCPGVTERLKNICNKYDVSLAYRNENKIKNSFQSTKDRVRPIEKSGIYEAKCGTNGCDRIYFGQRNRAGKNRFNEHLRYIENKERFVLKLYTKPKASAGSMLSNLFIHK